MKYFLAQLLRPTKNFTFPVISAAPIHSSRSLSRAAMKPTASDQPGKDFLKFVNASPTPFHAVHKLKERLKAAKFQEIRERDDWSEVCKPGGRYFLTRNGSSIIAFAVGGAWKPGNSVAMVATHTDSPCMRVKPTSKAQNHGYLQVGVEMYGGGLWHTWFDRDLSLAGRVMAKTPQGEFHQRLVHITKPILRIPTLAVHFDRQTEFSFSKENQLYPIAGLVEAELNRQGKTADEAAAADGDNDADFASMKPVTERHHARIVELLAKEAGVAPGDVQDFECVLYDTQKSCTGGLNDELVFSARLDNLMMTYCAAEALVESAAAVHLSSEPSIRLFAAFDNEEIGSLTQQGADSSLLPGVIRRLSVLAGPSKAAAQPTAYEQTMAKSFLISADMAHAVHPNYAGKHEARHHPQINGGPVIKINVNGRYTTTSPGMVLLREAGQRAGVPLQLFVINQDSLCGGTIGPMLAAKLGSRAVDLGNPQLSMHSVRETGGVYDVDYAVRLFASFYEHYAELEKKIIVD